MTTAADRFKAADIAAAQAADDGEDSIDMDSLYDSERVAIGQVFTRLGINIGSHRELSGFQREVRERFAEIGFVARCDFYEDIREGHLEGAQVPQITITGRCEPLRVGEFDHEQMGHEVRSNIVDKKGQDNVQRTQVAPGWGATKSGLVVPD